MIHMVRSLYRERESPGLLTMNRQRNLSLLCLLGLFWRGTSYALPPAANPNGVVTLRQSWRMQSSYKVENTGAAISSPGFSDATWYPVSVPTTVVSALLKLKHHPDPAFGMNLRKLPGVTYQPGENFSNFPMRQDSPFMVPWWFRKAFQLPATYKGKTTWLYFGGINYRANIFLNGKQIGGAARQKHGHVPRR